MTELMQLLCGLISAAEISSIEHCLRQGQRYRGFHGAYFIKAGTAAQGQFFSSLCNECRFYALLQNCTTALRYPEPLLIHQDEALCILVLKRLQGKALAEEREAPGLQYDSAAIAAQLALLHELPISGGIFPVNDPIAAVEKNCNLLHDNTLKQRIVKILVQAQPQQLVFSHGDLLPRNILQNGNDYMLLDYEWASFCAPQYDMTLLKLFTGKVVCNLEALAIVLREVRLLAQAGLPARQWPGKLEQVLSGLEQQGRGENP